MHPLTNPCPLSVLLILQALRSDHANEMKDLALLHQKQQKQAVAAAKVDFEQTLHQASLNHETSLKVALDDLRSDLAEQHQYALTQALNELRNAHSLELHASLSETKIEQNERFSATTREMIERLGR